MKITEKKNERIHLGHIKMSRNSPIDKNQGIDFYDKYEQATLVSGPPSSGKTSLIIHQLTSRKGILRGIFDKIYIFSPSLSTIQKSIELPPDQLISSFDVEKLEQILMEQKARTDNGEHDYQVCLIFDDLMADVVREGMSSSFMKLILNRSHYHIDIIVIVQTYNSVPLMIRKAFSNVIQFKTNNLRELENINSEIVGMKQQDWNYLVKQTMVDKHDFLLFNNSNIYRNFNRLIIE
jgi:hypothetical protein